MAKIVLFDLDGTLLPMDQDTFVKAYFKLLAAKLMPRGYEANSLIDGIWSGTSAMVKNDGSCTNEKAFWNHFAGLFGEHVREDEPIFAEYYRTDFQQVAGVCGHAPEARQVIDMLKDAEVRVVLATNPIFPAVATESRMKWAGLSPADFELYTTYENSRYCKPNPEYYKEIFAKLGCEGSDCIMVGNDVEEDMVPASALGAKVFLLTDCLINKKERDINAYPHGGFAELKEFLKENI